MNRKYKQDPITGYIRQPFVRIALSGVFLLGAFTVGAVLFPYYSSSYWYISTPIATFTLLCAIWMNFRPNLHARFFFNTGISTLFIILAFRAFNNNLLIEAIIIVTIIVAHTLPMWNSSAANFIRQELSSPKTKIGKIAFSLTLALIPVAGVLGATLGLFLDKGDKYTGQSFMIGTISWLMAILWPFIYRFPSSPWESSTSSIDEQDSKKQEAKEELPLSKKAPSRRISSNKKKLNGK